MRNNQRKIGLLVFFMVAAVASQAFAWGNPPGRPEPIDRAKMLERISKKIELTAEQKAKIEAGAEARRKEMEGNRTQLRETMTNMNKELLKDTPDRALVHRYIDELNKLNGEMQHRRIDDILDMKAILTPEQNKKFNEMFEKPRRFGFGKERRPLPKR